MEKLRMETTDITDKNIKKIAALFPNVITEMKDEKGKLKKGIKFELLKQELSGDVIDGEECYDFTWVGKKAAIVESNTPIRKTLRPCIEESKDWENTENLYIEGDNLEVLKLLQESYLNSIKMIYIDPPYNTGNDFIYKDNFKIDKDEYEEQIGLYDEEDNRMFKNTDTNGRFHSDWCSMMYPRLKLALNLLSEDGVIFISIDDNEVENLKKICNEVFGETNFISSIIWEKKYGIQNDAKYFSVSHDYILVYAKNKPLFTPNLLP
ncbi:MAG: site-specific DNA-methyltransferase, partial [Tissierellia bacterium]|nr:site-specific DNA-methyltransferase [Tissierellia bacterium]